MDSISFPLYDSIRTDYSGFRQLFRLYNELREHYHKTIFIDFSSLDWIDANLSAVFNAIMYKLSKDNDLTFTADGTILSTKFDVLLRNGFIKPNNSSVPNDVRKSTVPCKHFSLSQKAEFKEYIQSDLLTHRGIPKSLTHDQKKRIKIDLLEIFSNVFQHALTQEPFFVCGQYFPKDKLLKFTMTDLGCGFLPPIKNFSKNEIETDIDAIRWALSGNSTKTVSDEPGGCGLSGIHEYCKENSGNFQIISGEAFWGLDLENTIFRGSRGFEKAVIGSTVNIFFKCL